MRLTKLSKLAAILGLGIYIVYVAGSAIFLDTSLFAKVAGMENEEQTYVHLHGAISPFPGLLYVQTVNIFISDQNVSIHIDVHHAWAKFSLSPFLKKRVLVDHLDVKDATLDIGMKTLAESTAYQKKYVKPEDLDLKIRAEEVKEDEKSHLSLIFPDIKIANISEIKSGLGDFKGKINLEGGFMIQPKVHVEVYPTKLKFFEGQIPEQFSRVEGEVNAKIHNFRMIDAPGNAVFPYFDANMRMDIGLKSLKMLNLTVRKLPGYAFEGADTRLSIQAALKDGLLQTGSVIAATPTELYIHTPGLNAKGFGEVRWEVDSKNTSSLHASIDNVSLRDQASVDMLGSIRHTDLRIKLFGNELIDSFKGQWITLGLKSIHWNIHSNQKNPNLKYNGVVSGDGTLAAFSGEIPTEEKARETAKSGALKLSIDSFAIQSSFISNINGSGNIVVKAKPVDLLDNSTYFPAVDVNLKLGIGKFGSVNTKAHFKNIEYHLAPVDSWKGQLDWDMDKTDPLIDALVERKSLSGFLGKVAKVNQLVIKMDCEVAKDYAWIRVDQINSSGIWKAYGTLTNQPEGMKGVFEARVFDLPVGIRIRPDKTDVRFLPSAEWYDESQPGLLRGVQ
jgi:hypothetical protein